MQGVCVKSTCTKTSFRRRGTAEIELLLCVILIVTLLLLLAGLIKFSRGLLQGTAAARYAAFHDATVTPNPQYAPDSSPTPGLDSSAHIGYANIRNPQLPVRLHVPRLSQNITIFVGTGFLPQITLQSTAAVGSPAWAYNAYPVPSDRAITQQWFENYIDESVAPLRDPLDLAPAWAP